jgi:hypothetical protein
MSSNKGGDSNVMIMEFMAGLAGHYTSFVERSIDRNLSLVKSILAKGAFSPAVAKDCAERCTAFVDRVVQKNLGVAELLLADAENACAKDACAEIEEAKNKKRSRKALVEEEKDEEEKDEEDVEEEEEEEDEQQPPQSRCERALVYIYKRRDAADNSFEYSDIRTDEFYELMGDNNNTTTTDNNKVEFTATHQLRAKGLIEHLRTDSGKKKRGMFRLTPKGLRRARELLRKEDV